MSTCANSDIQDRALPDELDVDPPQWLRSALRVGRLEARSVALAWDPAFDPGQPGGELTYEVRHSESAVARVHGTEHRLLRLTPGTSYRVEVRALDEAGNASSPLFVAFTTPAHCAAPLPLVPAGVTP